VLFLGLPVLFLGRLERGESVAQGFDRNGAKALAGEEFDLGENLGAAVDPAGGRVGFGGDVEQLERELHRLLLVSGRGGLAAPAVDPLENAPRGGRAGAGNGEVNGTITTSTGVSYVCGNCAMQYVDSPAPRVSVGGSVIWDSPFGPLRFDLAYPLLKQPYDRTQFFQFGGGTRF